MPWRLILLASLTIFLTGCSLGLEEEHAAKQPINAAAWPTPAPTHTIAQPTPFPRATLPPTPTPPPPAAAALPAPAATAPVAANSAALTEAVMAQVSRLGGLSPAAVAFVTRDNTVIYQRPGVSATGKVDSAEMLAILGKDAGGGWLYVITISAQQGWIQADALRITGSLAQAPVLPPDPLAAFLAQAVGAVPAPAQADAPAPAQADVPAPSQPAAQPAAAVQTSRPAMFPNTLAAVTEAVVNTKVDLRRGPAESFGTINTITVDEQVAVLAVNPARDWAVVQAPNNRVGWAPLSALTLQGSVDAALPVLSAWVNSNALEVKSGPGIYFETAGTLSINDLVSVLALNPGKSWVLVQSRAGGLGWLPLRFLTLGGALTAVPEFTAKMAAASVEPVDLPAPVAVVAGRPIAQSQLVIQTSSGGDIMVINPNGSGLRRLTGGIDPALSPDGQTVAFTRWQGETGSVWLVGLDGSNERQVLDFTKQAKGAAWSPDGSQVAVNFQHGGRLDNKQVCKDADKAGRPPRNAFDLKGGVRVDSDGDMQPIFCYTLPPDPYWSLRVVNLADGSFKDFDGGTYAFRPAWNPAQPWRIVSDGGQGLVALDVNNPAAQQRLSQNVGDGSPVFSPDGRYLVVSAGQEGSDQGHNLYRLNTDGSGRIRLTETPLWVSVQPEGKKQWNNVAPAWAPDGSQIAFLTDRTGRWEIWAINPDGSIPHPLFSNEINDQLNIQYNFVDERVISWQ
jgi:uncharacterized protein YgiM (DUF1202 family)